MIYGRTPYLEINWNASEVWVREAWAVFLPNEFFKTSSSSHDIPNDTTDSNKYVEIWTYYFVDKSPQEMHRLGHFCIDEMIFSKSVMTGLKTQYNWVLVSINSIESSVYHFKWSFEGSVWGCKCLMFNCSELSFILLNTCASSLHNKYDRKSFRNSYAAAFPSFQFLK